MTNPLACPKLKGGMMKIKLLTLVVLMSLTAVSGALAVDEGQTQPRLDKASAYYGQIVDLIPTTSGAGNVKGIQCRFSSGATYLLASFVVDGGTPQSFRIPDNQFSPADSSGARYTEFIPMNIRFDSSIRVQMVRSTGSPLDSGSITCVASWGLD